MIWFDYMYVYVSPRNGWMKLLKLYRSEGIILQAFTQRFPAVRASGPFCAAKAFNIRQNKHKMQLPYKLSSNFNWNCCCSLTAYRFCDRQYSIETLMKLSLNIVFTSFWKLISNLQGHWWNIVSIKLAINPIRDAGFEGTLIKHSI